MNYHDHVISFLMKKNIKISNIYPLTPLTPPKNRRQRHLGAPGPPRLRHRAARHEAAHGAGGGRGVRDFSAAEAARFGALSHRRHLDRLGALSQQHGPGAKKGGRVGTMGWFMGRGMGNGWNIPLFQWRSSFFGGGVVILI